MSLPAPPTAATAARQNTHFSVRPSTVALLFLRGDMTSQATAKYASAARTHFDRLALTSKLARELAVYITSGGFGPPPVTGIDSVASAEDVYVAVQRNRADAVRELRFLLDELTQNIVAHISSYVLATVGSIADAYITYARNTGMCTVRLTTETFAMAPGSNNVAAADFTPAALECFATLVATATRYEAADAMDVLTAAP